MLSDLKAGEKVIMFNRGHLSWSNYQFCHFNGHPFPIIYSLFVLQMATKNQLALLLLTCAVMAVLIQPAIGQKDALRWGKRGSELWDDYAENPRAYPRHHYDDDYPRRFLHRGMGCNITDPWNLQSCCQRLLSAWNNNYKTFCAIRKHKWPQSP